MKRALIEISTGSYSRDECIEIANKALALERSDLSAFTKPNNDLTAKQVRSLFNYDAVTGYFYWLVDRGSVKKGQKAGYLHGKGYWIIKVNGVKYSAHRLAWLYSHGAWPELHIDHIDGNKLNNRIENLRDSNPSSNAKNMSLSKANKSGYNGVCFKENRWRSEITVDGVLISLGSFKLIEDAIKERKKADIKYGFSERHGT